MISAFPPLAGVLLCGRYRVSDRIGRSGMGIVYEGVFVPFDRRIAVKVLDPALAVSAVVVKAFREEAYAVAREVNPVVRLADVGVTDQGLPFAVFDYPVGVDFGAWLAEGKTIP